MQQAGQPRTPVRRVAVVFNPATFRGKTAERRQELRDDLAARGLDVLWFETTPEDPGQGLVREALEHGVDLVLVSGGDGTIMPCVTALAGTDVPLAVLPTGTGNLLAVNMRIPRDPQEALTVALHGRRRLLDVGALGDERFMVMSGVGFDAAMLRDTSPTLKARVHALAYVVSALRNLRRPATRLEIRLDDRPAFTRVGQGVLVGNLGRLQGGLRVLPDARPDDGLLDVAVLKATSITEWLLLAIQVLRRSDSGGQIERHQAERIEIICERELPVERDGELAGPARHLVFKVLPGTLRLCVPDEPGR